MEYLEEIVQPEEYSLVNLFRGTEYIVPIYQRNYAWESDEIEQLLEDINDSTGKYYLGSLIVNQQSASVFEVIDGQQRLTTIFLLLSYLNDESVNRNSLRFEAREKSNKTLSEINKIKNTTDELEKEPWFSEEIINGYSIIKKYFLRKTEESKGFADDFKNKLAHIAIIRTQVPKKIDLNHYFEIMNTRGEQLELHEIVKGNILSVIDSREDKIIAASIWDACALMDRYVQMSFPKQVRENVFGDDWVSFPYQKYEDIRPLFMIEGKVMGNSGSDENKYTLISKLREGFKRTKKESKDNKSEENERIESIISFPNFLLQVNEAVSSAGIEDDAGLDDKKFISLMKAHYADNDSALSFIFSLLKYRMLFDKYIIKREYAKDYRIEGRWSLQRIEKYIGNKGPQPTYTGTYNTGDTDNNSTKRVRLLQSCLRITYTSPKTMHWISKALAELAKSEGIDLQFVLEKYCCDKILASEYKSREGFGIDRIVFTYLDYVLSRDKADNYQFQFRTSIEHFFPQHPITKNVWDAKSLNCFGNLALITVSANSKFSNMLPHQKAEDYPEYIEQSPKLMLMRDLMMKNNGIWEIKTAKDHNDEMMKILDDEIKNHK